MRLELDLLPQPDDTTCGPTCLHALYRYWGETLPLDRVIDEVATLPEGGTLAVSLAKHALRRGYNATITTYNLTVFDPTWFDEPERIAEHLKAQAAVKTDPKLRHATKEYLDFLALGGRIAFEDLTEELVLRHIESEVPILAGLSATYLYQCARELDDDYEPIRGEPSGHFVIVEGYDAARREMWVADPQFDYPGFEGHHYPVAIHRLISSILLGVLSWDANLLVITPKERAPGLEMESG